MNFWSRMSVAVKAFREGYVTADLLDTADFADFAARQLRYAMLWAWYENTAYRNIHTWAASVRTTYGLYKYIRNIYNPSFRLVEFWKTVVWGGLLSDEAKEEGAIPIRTEDEKVRNAIATLWNASNWAQHKETLVMWGTALGDTAIKIVDDIEHEEVRLVPIHPASLKELVVDSRGKVTTYSIEEPRWNEELNKNVMFRETATQINETEVQFETFADDRLYEWNGQSSVWVEPYPLVPMVPIQHNRVGLEFGWPEIHPEKSKVMELDDLASKMHDYMRKLFDPVWLFNFRKPKNTVDMTPAGAAATVGRPEPGREEMPAIYASDSNAKAFPLVTNQVNIESAGQRIDTILEELERDLPELQMDIWSVGGYTTGKAMKTARQRVERKVIQRRPNYDSPLVMAHKIALSIGGIRGYEGYEGFSAESVSDDTAKHSIPSDRPIFQTDASEDIAAKKGFWDIIVQAKKQGLPLDMVLADLGWSPSKIATFVSKVEAEQAEADKKADEIAAQMKTESDVDTNNPDEQSGDQNSGEMSQGAQDARNRREQDRRNGQRQ